MLSSTRARTSETLRRFPQRSAADDRADFAAFAGRLPATERRSVKMLGGRKRAVVELGPGCIRVGSETAPGWEVDSWSDKEFRDAVAELVDVTTRPELDLGAGLDELTRRAFDRARIRLDAARARAGLDVVSRRGTVGEWSAKSRARMTRTLAMLDWSIFTDTPGYAACMLTLTYPGNWEQWCPTGRELKRHLAAFRSAVERRLDVGAHASWKLEFQRRGAPHVHLFILCPVGPAATEFRLWARSTWARIVGATGIDRERHELAGVSMDWHEAGRMTDPVRLAVYFSKHNAPGRSSKEYQHRVPEQWMDDGQERVGRWWGVWSIERASSSVYLDDDGAVDLVRCLRAWVRSQRRTVVQEVERTQTSIAAELPGGGVMLRERKKVRRVRRRYRVRALSFSWPAGFVMANDAPALAEQLARALVEGPDWPPGRPRPLP